MNITIKGIAYPLRQTMGAMLRFKRETGKEVSSLSQDSITDILTYLYCCIASAAHADGIAFNLTLEDFADNLSAQEIISLANSLNDGAVATNEKKK